MPFFCQLEVKNTFIKIDTSRTNELSLIDEIYTEFNQPFRFLCLFNFRWCYFVSLSHSHSSVFLSFFSLSSSGKQKLIVSSCRRLFRVLFYLARLLALLVFATSPIKMGILKLTLSERFNWNDNFKLFSKCWLHHVVIAKKHYSKTGLRKVMNDLWKQTAPKNKTM